MMSHASMPRWAAVWLAMGVAIAWLTPSPYFNNLNNPNENVRVYMTRSIVEFGTFAIDDVVAEWGYVNDKATYEGRLYPGKAPARASSPCHPTRPTTSRTRRSTGRRASTRSSACVGSSAPSSP